MSEEIGELLEQPGMLKGEWRISNFLSLPQGKGQMYSSPRFLYLDSCWRCVIDLEDNEWIGVYLGILNCYSPKEVRFTFGIKEASGENEKVVTNSKTFSQNSSWGVSKYLTMSDLRDRRTDLAPSDVLTICYSLKSKDKRPSEGSLFRRLFNMSLSLGNLLSSGEKSDVTFKLKDGEIPAHKMILESRSAVFDRMFSIDMAESHTGEVNIPDATKDAFQVVLFYVYGGIPKGLNSKNACEVYKIAHRYELEELRKVCTQLIQETLSVKTVCDVVTLADLYHEKALKACFKDYFVKNKSDVFRSEEWKIFKRDNPAVVSEIFEWVFGEEV